MYKFWYGYVKPKYGENAKDIAEDVEVKFEILNQTDLCIKKTRTKKLD